MFHAVQNIRTGSLFYYKSNYLQKIASFKVETLQWKNFLEHSMKSSIRKGVSWFVLTTGGFNDILLIDPIAFTYSMYAAISNM